MSTHQEYVDAVKKAAISTGKKALITYLTKKVPYLFVPVLGPVVSLLLGKVVEILIKETEFAIFFQYIDMRVDGQGRDFSEAVILNHKAHLSGDKDEIIKAEANLIKKFRAFVILGI